MNTALLLLTGALLGAAAWRSYCSRRERLAEEEARDREYRESLIRRDRIRHRTGEEEDYRLRLRAGAKAKSDPTAPVPKPTRSQNKFLG